MAQDQHALIKSETDNPGFVNDDRSPLLDLMTCINCRDGGLRGSTRTVKAMISSGIAAANAATPKCFVSIVGPGNPLAISVKAFLEESANPTGDLIRAPLADLKMNIGLKLGRSSSSVRRYCRERAKPLSAMSNIKSQQAGDGVTFEVQRLI